MKQFLAKFPRFFGFTVWLAAAGLLITLPFWVSETAAHVVAHGETLGSIASRHNVTVDELIRFNSIKDPNRLQVGQVINIPGSGNAPSSAQITSTTRSYTVQKGDVLSKIASKFGLGVQDLIRANNIPNPNALSVGDRLLIPNGPVAGNANPIPSSPKTLPASLKKELDRIKVVSGKWKYVVVHHSATDKGSAAGMDAYHRKQRHMENGLAYHFVIGNGKGMPDGAIEIGSRWRRQIKGGHVASTALNEKSIGICLVGNFEKYKPTQRQLQSLQALNQYLMQRTGLSATRVVPHREINPKPTKCPGKQFPTRQMT